MACLRASGLCYSYPDSSARAVDGVDLEIRQGEHVALLGANGSGKTSLSRLLAGLLHPQSGSVTADGLPADAEGAFGPARSRMGILFQSPQDQIVGSEAILDAAFAPENQGLRPAEAVARARAALAAVGLSGREATDPRRLSPGQQQLLALAGILAAAPDCVILDEASSMLDPVSRAAYRSALSSLLAEGKTVISVTQSMEEAARAPRCLVMAAGKIVFDGSPALLFSSRSLSAWGLEPPPALRLIRSLSLEGEGGTALPDEEDAAAAIAAALPAGKGDRAPREREASEGSPPPRAQRSPDEEPALSCRDLSFRYPGSSDEAGFAVKGASFAVGRGELVAIAGAAGSGKSTFLQILASLYLPQEGKVTSLGADTLDPRLDAPALRRRAPMALQRPEYALFEPFAADDAAYGPRCAGIGGTELLERVRSAFSLVSLPWNEFKDRHPRGLSGGERRRLALAGILALGPELCIFDEPTASLDPAGRASVCRLLVSLARSGKAVIFSSHDMEEVALADRAVVFSSGSIVFSGSPRELFYRADPAAWALELPFAPRLRSALAARGLEIPEVLGADEALAAAGALLGREAAGSRTVQTEALSIPPLPAAPLLGKKRRRTGKDFFLLQRIVLPGEAAHGKILGGLTPAGKYLWLFALGLPAMLSWGIALPLIVMALALGIAALEGASPLRIMKGLIPIIPFFLLYALILALVPDSGFGFSPTGISPAEARSLAALGARMAALMAVLGTFAAVCPVTELSHGIEDILRPLSPRGRMAASAGLSTGIVFRFIPSIAEEAEQIMKAQAARGSPGYSGSARARLRTAASLIVPLSVRALERSEALALAMEARGWTGSGRIRSRQYKSSGKAKALMALIAIAGIALAVLAAVLP